MAGNEQKLKALQGQEAQRRLSREELLRPRIVTQEETLETMGGLTVMLRSFTFEQRSQIKQECGAGTPQFDEDKFQLLSIVEALVDPTLTVQDLEELKKQNGEIIDELVMKITVLNLLGRSGELKKESEMIPS